MRPSLFILELLWQPVVGPPYIALAAALLAGLAIRVYTRTIQARHGLGLLLLSMRLTAIAALALLLLGPSFAEPAPPAPTKPRLTVLLDASASMQTRDCFEAPRFEVAARQWLAQENLDRLRRGFDLKLLAFDTELRPLTPEMLNQPALAAATGRASRIGLCLGQALDQMPFIGGDPAGSDLLLISDGRDTDDRPLAPLAQLAKARNIRLHTLCLGGPDARRDLALTALPSQDAFLIRQGGTIVARIRQVGLAGAKTLLHVRSAAGESAMPVVIADAPETSVTIPLANASAGTQEYRLALDPVEGESRTDNNTQTVFFEVSGKRIKTLLLEGQPSWDMRFLAQALRQDERIELTAMVQLAPNKRDVIVTRPESPQNHRNPQPPRTAGELAAYDVVILGRQIDHLLSPEAIRLLPEFVAHGGHLIFARGRACDASSPAALALAILEPVSWGNGVRNNLPLALTPAGRDRPLLAQGDVRLDSGQTLAQLPPVAAVQTVAAVKPAALTLAQTAGVDPGRPALLRMDYGRGETLTLLAEELWRWRLLPPAQANLAGLYDTLWTNLVRWLALGGDFQPGQQISLSVSPLNARLGDRLSIDIAARWMPSNAYEPKAKVIDPAGNAHELALPRSQDRHWKTTWPIASPGEHRVVVEAAPLLPQTLEKRFCAYDIDLERLEVSANPQALRQLSQETHGMAFEPNDADQWPRMILGASAGGKPALPRRRWAWDHGSVLAMLMTWMGIEWLARRRAGWL